MKTILIPNFEINGLGSYPDDAKLFANMQRVTFQGVQYWLCEYAGDKHLETGPHTYVDYKASITPSAIPVTNIQVVDVTAAPLINKNGIYRVGKGETFKLTANVPLPDTAPGDELVVIIEKLVNGNQVIDDTRALGSVKSGVLTVEKAINVDGNWALIAARQNQGLATIGAPFRFEFDVEKVEFNVI